MGTWGKTAADSFSGFGKDWLSKIKKENEFSYDEYKEDGDVTKAKEAYDTHLLNKPGDYHSRWAGQLDSIMGKIAGRKPFEYDINADALYQQAAERYAHLGKIGMEDAIGKSSALTGGYGNSFAQSAGQQAYAESLNDLNNMIPQFYQMALDKYIMEGNQLSEQYGMISDREGMDYGRYRDSISDWMLERDHLADRYDFAREFDYSKYKDERGFAYDEYRDDIADKQWLKEFKATEAHNAWVRSQTPGGDPDDPGYDNEGLEDSKIKEMQKFLGIEADGKWGSDSIKAAGNLSAKEAWEAYQAGNLEKFGTPWTAFAGSTYDDAVTFVQQHGVPAAHASGIMTASEWSRRRSSYQNSGKGGAEVTNYNTYKEYLSAITEYLIEKYN